MLVLHGLGAGDDEADGAEVIGVGGARIAAQEGVGAEQDGGAGVVEQLRHDAVVQRRGIEVDRHAAEQRHHQAAGQAEGMEHGQHVEHHVLAVGGEAREALRGVGEDVAVRQHHALGHALRARREQDDGGIVGVARDALARCRRGCPRSCRARPMLGAHVLQVDDAHVLARARRRASVSRALSTNARERDDDRTPAARHAALILAAPLVKLIIAGTRPIACRAKNVTATPAEFGSMTPTALALGRERLRACAPSTWAPRISLR